MKARHHFSKKPKDQFFYSKKINQHLYLRLWISMETICLQIHS
ncbi:hypothetical protein CPter291_2418 [Collimonas pratensis]|uniref:Uncharacterized protein n=1 Tax=Collimonas pratensis TaxID=279113 RepID=A0ABM5Z6I4_9BURK|nr:hypothetical protein CPter291_2418 [Collimonas pratensis]